MSAFSVRGGLQFASDAHPGFWNADSNNIQPRAGFAYQLNQKTVVRGGIGVYTVPFIIAGNFQPGFSQTHVARADAGRSGLTFQATLANPFPTACCSQSGASRGADTLPRPGHRPVRAARFQQRAEHALYRQRAARAAGPVAARGRLRRQPRLGPHDGRRRSGGGDRLNAIPVQYLSTSRVRDQATIDFLAQLVTNPFADCCRAPASTARRSRARSCCARTRSSATCAPFDDDGTSELQLGAVQDREAVHAAATRCWRPIPGREFTERVFKLNPSDTDYEDRLSAFDVPHRVTHQRDLGAAVRPRAGVGPASASGSPTRSSAAGACRRSGSSRADGRSTSTIATSTSTATWRALKSDYSGDTNQPVFDISGFYFHDAAVQTNGVDDPTKQRADSAHPAGEQRPLLPVAHRRPAQPEAEPVGHLDRQAGAAQRPRARAVQRRVPERVQPAGVQQPEHRSDQRRFRQGDEPEQPAARHPARGEDRVLS